MNTKQKKKLNLFQEFSKFILFLFAAFYFLGGLFILWVVHYQLTHALTPEYISAEVVVTYFTAPITAGLVMYFGKAAVENFQKIKGSNHNNSYSGEADTTNIKNKSNIGKG